ncbi:Lipase 3 [Frankliniella fusca]|uniref:Lipase n=1 Tax=Frankliniella fusca TaxID=407009 RepID=A0AAE1HHB3_9NEOP|nr:Lipase 3 [Frankliniella fusca]
MRKASRWRILPLALGLLGLLGAAPASAAPGRRGGGDLLLQHALQGLSVMGSLDAHPRGTYALLTAQGFPVEEHSVRTQDGYLLGLFRIPRPGRPAVLLYHGLLNSSADLVLLGRGRALPQLLYAAGFDVWLGNARGTAASQRHEWLRPNQAEFWDFTWHEIGTLDLPAVIDYVLAETGQATLHYVGHSQGTTTFFVLGSERPEYMDKVATFTGLAPVAYTRDMRSVPLQLLALAPNFFGGLLSLFGIHKLGDLSIAPWLGDTFCSDGKITQPLCADVMFVICGWDPAQLNMTMIPEITANTPASVSVKQLVHYGQLAHSRDLAFRQFDLGRRGNLKKYNATHPPDYDLSRVRVPTYLVYGANDLLSVQSNIDKLSLQLPSIAPGGLRRVPYDRFTHLDFIFGTNAKELVYDDVIAKITRSLNFETDNKA